MGPIRHVKKVVMISALLLVLTLSLGGGVASKSNDSAATYENLKLFTEVLSIIQSQYVDEVPPKDVIYGAIKGTLRGLDPHSLVPRSRDVPGDAGRDDRQLRRPRHRDHAEGRRADRGGADRGHARLPRGHPVRRPHRQDRGPVHQGHAAHRRREADARQAREQGDDQHRPRGLGGGEGLPDRPRADPRAVGEEPGARAGHRVHPAAPVPGADARATSRPRSRSTRRTGRSRASSSTSATTRAASSPRRSR